MGFSIQHGFDFEAAEKAYDDHAKLLMTLKALPSERLLRHLAHQRKGRRDRQYPLHNMLACFVAMMVYNHGSFRSVRRELMRNRDLRYACFGRNDKGDVPSEWAFSRFMKKFSAPESFEYLREMFDGMVDELRILLPGFGAALAGDSTDVASRSNGTKDKETGTASDTDASWRKYEHKFTDAQGSAHKSVKKWFGYKLHLLVDATYELPVAFSVTGANVNDAPALKKMLDHHLFMHPAMMPESVALDGAYDDNPTHKHLWERDILPVIHRNKRVRKEPEGIFDMAGVPVCTIGSRMAYKVRDGKFLKYVCPDSALVCCKDRCETKVAKLQIGKGGDFVNYRALPAHTGKFKREYKKRTSAERVISRLKDGYRVGRMNVMGMAKTTALVSLSLLCMLGFALAAARQGEAHRIRTYAA